MPSSNAFCVPSRKAGATGSREDERRLLALPCGCLPVFQDSLLNSMLCLKGGSIWVLSCGGRDDYDFEVEQLQQAPQMRQLVWSPPEQQIRPPSPSPSSLSGPTAVESNPSFSPWQSVQSLSQTTRGGISNNPGGKTGEQQPKLSYFRQICFHIRHKCQLKKDQ